MFNNLKYDYKFKNIYDIPFEFYNQKNLKYLFLDFDNTIVLHDKSTNSYTREFFKWYKKALKENLELFIISNNKNPDRVNNFVNKLKIQKFSNCKKPSIIVIEKIIKRYNIPKENAVIIGDRLLTDILAGKKANIKTILVEPLGKDNNFLVRFIIRPLENFIKKFLIDKK